MTGKGGEMRKGVTFFIQGIVFLVVGCYLILGAVADVLPLGDRLQLLLGIGLIAAAAPQTEFRRLKSDS